MVDDPNIPGMMRLCDLQPPQYPSEKPGPFTHRFLGRALSQSTDPKARREANEIINNSLRARDLVQRLSRSVRSKPQSTLYAVFVHEVVEEAIQAARPRWRDEAEVQGIAIEMVTALAEVPSIRGEKSELFDVVLNLLFNAVDALPHGGTITARTRAVRDEVELIVGDTGPGMTEEVRRRVFEPFFTTKLDVGSGLGLSTVYRTVTQWGGRIEVESAPGQGTTFTLRFPAWSGPGAREEGPAPAAPPVRSGRLLVVEDEEAVSKALSRILSAHHEVEICAGGEEALKRFARGCYDVALIDLGIPGIPGDKLARKLKEVDPAVSFVLVTGWDLAENDPHRQGFDFYIQNHCCPR